MSRPLYALLSTLEDPPTRSDATYHFCATPKIAGPLGLSLRASSTARLTSVAWATIAPIFIRSVAALVGKDFSPFAVAAFDPAPFEPPDFPDIYGLPFTRTND